MGLVSCKGSRVRIRTVLVCVLAIAIFAWFLNHANLADVWVQVRRARLDLLIVGFVMAVLTFVIRAYRWQYLLRPIGPTRFRTAFRTTVIGFAALAILPARAGDVLRPYLLARQEGLSTSATFATIVMERVLDLIAMLVLLAVYVWGTADPSRLPVPLLRTIEVSAALAGGAALVLMALTWIMATHPERIGRLVLSAARVLPSAMADRLAGYAQKFSSGFAVAREPQALAAAVFWSFLLWLVIAGEAWLIAIAFGIYMPFAGTFLLQALLVIGGRDADAGRRRQLSRGLSDRRHDVFRSRERRRSRCRHRHARHFLCPGGAGRDHLHGTRWFRFRPIHGAGINEAGRGDTGAPMKCPFCGHLGDKVVDSRESKEGEMIRRRRECLDCGRRFTSYERIDEIPYMVIKKNGTRERFERQKLIAGLLKACEKRPVSVAAVEAVADRVEATVQERPEKEMSTEEVGSLVMEELKRLDKVAYVRFASVYRHFRDIGEFMTELKDLLNVKE